MQVDDVVVTHRVSGLRVATVMGVFPIPGNLAFVEGVGRKRNAVEEVSAAAHEHETAHATERAHS